MKNKINLKKITGFIGALLFIMGMMITPRIESTNANPDLPSCHAPCTHWTTDCGASNCMKL